MVTQIHTKEETPIPEAMNPEGLSPLLSAHLKREKTTFACQMCGECCSSFNIPLEGEKATILLERDWVKARMKETNRELVKVTKDLYRIPLTKENICAFLGPDKMCLIEGHEGKELKPDQCLRFPFAALQMPDGEIIYETSSACKTIAEKHMPRFLQSVPSANAPKVEHEVLGKRIKRDMLRTIPLDQYFDYIETIRPLFENSDLSVDEALKTVQSHLHQIGKKKKRPTTPRMGMRPFTLSAAWERWLPVLFLVKPYGTLNTWQLATRGEYADPKIFGMPVPLQGHDKILWPEESLNPLMKAFLFQILQRKIMLSFGHNLTGQLVMAVVAYALVKWYSKTLALLEGKTAPDINDLTTAIRMTERYYTGHQPRFLEFFRTFPGTPLMERMLLGG